MNIYHLKKRIEEYKDTHLAPPKKRIRHYKVTASIICMEIIAAVVIGFFIGHLFDVFFNTKYIFKIICLIFAFIACFTVLYRLVRD